MYVYALGYRNPHHADQPFVLFLASKRLLTRDDAVQAALDTIAADALGNEWIEAVVQGALCGPLEIDGELRKPSIAVVVD